MSSKKRKRDKKYKSRPKQASVKDAVQSRITPPDHSSIIPGIDMNELKRSLDLLKYALDYSEAIVDTVKTPLVVLDKELRVLTANRSFYETFHLSPDNTENKLIYELNDEAWNIPKLRVLLEKILPKNTHFDNYEVEIILPHIGEKTMLLSGRKTYRQVNETEAILLAFEDITERKKIERQKDDFIGVVSHELKTPLTGLKAFSQILNKHLDKNKDKKGKFYLSKMNTQMERLTNLMASFVNVYKVQTGELDLHKKSFKIDRLINNTISDFGHTNDTHTIESKLKSKSTVYADEDRINQVLINLISNAIKYSPEADKIKISSKKEKKGVVVTVQDFGHGIAKDDQDKIFDRFYRVSEKKETSGLGLGLFISKEIINAHKGKIWLESTKENGTTFYFLIPVKESEKPT